ncbi:MAG: hypothetical protein GXY58_12690 [Planctomycetaceae bacterium]|nr:hypothetical protein [Planctomycetaceae bacterium]
MARITLAAIIALVTWGLALGPRQLPGQEPVPAAPAAGYLAGQQPGPVARHSMVPPTLPAREGAIPIPPPKPGARDRAPGSTSTTRGNMALVVLSSLAIVLGLFFFVVWLSRRAFPRATASLSSDVIEVLGRTPLASRHHLQLIRLGRRLLLVSVTADHAETLTEITDVDEVNHVTSLCRRQQPGSITDSFRQVLHQLDHKTPQRS